MCIVDLMKKDSEIKLLIGCTEEEEEKAIVYETHIETQFMKGILDINMVQRNTYSPIFVILLSFRRCGVFAVSSIS